MADFPSLLTPLAPPQLVSSQLQYKPVDLKLPLDMLSQPSMGRAASSKAPGEADSKMPEFHGTDGERMYAYNTYMTNKSEVDNAIKKYGELAYDMDSVKKKLNQNIYLSSQAVDEGRKDHEDDVDKFAQDLTAKNAKSNFNISRFLNDGTLMRHDEEVAYLNSVPYLDEREKAGWNYEIYAKTVNDSNQALAKVLDPMVSSMQNTGAYSNIMYKEQNGLGGIYITHDHSSSNNTAAASALAEAYRQAGFNMETITNKQGEPIGYQVARDKEGNLAWDMGAAKNEIVEGYFQDFLQRKDIQERMKPGGDLYNPETGKVDKAAAGQVFARELYNGINSQLQSRIRTDRNVSSSFYMENEEHTRGRGVEEKIMQEVNAPSTTIDANNILEVGAMDVETLQADINYFAGMLGGNKDNQLNIPELPNGLSERAAFVQQVKDAIDSGRPISAATQEAIKKDPTISGIINGYAKNINTERMTILTGKIGSHKFIKKDGKEYLVANEDAAERLSNFIHNNYLEPGENASDADKATAQALYIASEKLGQVVDKQGAQALLQSLSTNTALKMLGITQFNTREMPNTVQQVAKVIGVEEGSGFLTAMQGTGNYFNGVEYAAVTPEQWEGLTPKGINTSVVTMPAYSFENYRENVWVKSPNGQLTKRAFATAEATNEKTPDGETIYVEQTPKPSKTKMLDPKSSEAKNRRMIANQLGLQGDANAFIWSPTAVMMTNSMEGTMADHKKAASKRVVNVPIPLADYDPKDAKKAYINNEVEKAKSVVSSYISSDGIIDYQGMAEELKVSPSVLRSAGANQTSATAPNVLARAAVAQKLGGAGVSGVSTIVAPVPEYDPETETWAAGREPKKTGAKVTKKNGDKSYEEDVYAVPFTFSATPYVAAYAAQLPQDKRGAATIATWKAISADDAQQAAQAK